MSLFSGVPSLERFPLCVDIDNTVADTDAVLRRIIRSVTSGRVNLEHEDVVTYEYLRCRDSQGHRLVEHEWKEVVAEFHREGLSLALPMEGATAALRRLDTAYEIHLATTRDLASADLTKEWLKSNEIPHDRLHFAAHGEKHRLPISFSYAVEDDREQAYAFYAVGVRPILLSQPWNHTGPHSPVERLPSWANIANRLSPE